MKNKQLIFLFILLSISIGFFIWTWSQEGGYQLNRELQSFVRGSTIIVHGKVISVEDTYRQNGDKEFAFHIGLIEPIRFYKGEDEVDTPFEVRDLGHRGLNPQVRADGSTSSIGLGLTDQVTFYQDEEVVLFLEWLGLEGYEYLTPTGLDDAKFTIVTDEKGKRIILSNEHDYKEFKETGRIPIQLSGNAYPHDPDIFLRLLEQETKQN